MCCSVKKISFNLFVTLSLKKWQKIKVLVPFLQVSMSPHKNYFLMMVFGFFSLIFVVGLCCGRVTKRVHRELKNR